MLKPNTNVYTMVRMILNEVATLPSEEQQLAVTRAERWCCTVINKIRRDKTKPWSERKVEYQWWEDAETLLVGAGYSASAGIDFRSEYQRSLVKY